MKTVNNKQIFSFNTFLSFFRTVFYTNKLLDAYGDLYRLLIQFRMQSDSVLQQELCPFTVCIQVLLGPAWCFNFSCQKIVVPVASCSFSLLLNVYVDKKCLYKVLKKTVRNFIRYFAN